MNKYYNFTTELAVHACLSSRELAVSVDSSKKKKVLQALRKHDSCGGSSLGVGAIMGKQCCVREYHTGES